MDLQTICQEVFMYRLRSAWCILTLSSTLSIQSSDWLSEDLKFGAYLSFAGVGITSVWYQRTTTPTPELYQKTNWLLDDRFALNRSESNWNLGGSLVYDMSVEEHYALLKESILTPELLEYYEKKRINMYLDENVSPQRLRALKDRIIITCTFESINQKKLSDYNHKLQTTINELQSQNMWQQLIQRKADQELLQKLEYKQEQMIALQEIINARRVAIHYQKLLAIFDDVH